MKIADITTLTNDPAKEYSAGLKGCKTLDALWDFLDDWKELAHDAWKQHQKMTKNDFHDFLRLRAKKGISAAEEMDRRGFLVILMPEVLVMTTLHSEQFHVPWGLTFKRLLETGQLMIVDGHVERGDRTT